MVTIAIIAVIITYRNDSCDCSWLVLMVWSPLDGIWGICIRTVGGAGRCEAFHTFSSSEENDSKSLDHEGRLTLRGQICRLQET